MKKAMMVFNDSLYKYIKKTKTKFTSISTFCMVFLLFTSTLLPAYLLCPPFLSSQQIILDSLILKKFISNKFALLLWHSLVENLQVGQRPVGHTTMTHILSLSEVDLLFVPGSLFSLGKSLFKIQSGHMLVDGANDRRMSQQGQTESFSVIHVERKIKKHFLL